MSRSFALFSCLFTSNTISCLLLKPAICRYSCPTVTPVAWRFPLVYSGQIPFNNCGVSQIHLCHFSLSSLVCLATILSFISNSLSNPWCWKRALRLSKPETPVEKDTYRALPRAPRTPLKTWSTSTTTSSTPSPPRRTSGAMRSKQTAWWNGLLLYAVGGAR